jgi:pyruvate formate lyase activating enzyme
VQCTLCPQDCRISDGARGACGVRINARGRLYTLVHDRLVARSVEPVEKKPLFHFFPGSAAYSIATVGCPLHCSFCQNWDISQWPRGHLPRLTVWEAEAAAVTGELEALQRGIPGERLSPRLIVDDALARGARSIAYTYVEPTVFYELAYETAQLARAAGLKNIFVTCGYTSEEPLRRLAGVLDGANVDLKFFRDPSYKRISRARLQPVLDAIRLYRELGVWVEVTTLVIPGINDSEQELRDIAEFVRSVGPDVPWHVSRFHPAYRMLDRPPTPAATLRMAAEIGRAAGLWYVYQGNLPGGGGEDTRCPNCGSVVIARYGNVVRGNRVRAGRCPDCFGVIHGVHLDGG